MRCNAERLKKPGQMRIIDFVEDDKAGIDRHFGAVHKRKLRIGVAAGAVLRLEQHDIVTVSQQPGRRQAGDTGTDHGKPWRRLSHPLMF